MTAPEGFTFHDGYASCHPVVKVTLQEGVELVSRILASARENQILRLLLNTTDITGFAPPKTLDRFQMAEKFVGAVQSAVKVAMVARPEIIDREKFGVIVARNRGLLGNVFTTEAEAVAWLLDPGAC